MILPKIRGKSVDKQKSGKMEAQLRMVAVENEPNPAKINWGC